MSQPPFQPPPPPAQPPQNVPNPYGHPGPPPVPPQQARGFGPPPAAQQPPMYGGPAPFPAQAPYPMQPGPPFQAPQFGQRPVSSGNPVGAVFLGFLVSLVVSLLYTGVVVATYKDQSHAAANVLYFAHALLNGALVGALVGKMAPARNGARIGGAVIAALGTFFGYTNAIPVVILKDQSDFALRDMLEYEPFFPAKAWWHGSTHGGVDWLNILGVLVAVAAAWGIAYLVGNKRVQAQAGPHL